MRETGKYRDRDARLLGLIQAYQDPSTRAAAWTTLAEELRSVRFWFGRLWFVFNVSDETKGRSEAVQAADRALAEILAGYATDQRTSGVALHLFNKIRDKIKPYVRARKKTRPQYEFDESQMPPDESREIAAPAGLSPLAENLWDGKISPEAFLTRAREAGLITATQHHIIRRIADGENSRTLGAELRMKPSTVRTQLMQARNRLMFGVPACKSVAKARTVLSLVPRYELEAAE